MSVSLVDLERQLKSVTKTGKYVVGRKEVLSSLKGSKLVVWSASANVPPQILSECKTLQIPALRFDGNPIELGKTCGIPYKVSVIAVKSPGDAVLSPFEGSKDYSEQKSSINVRQLQQMEQQQQEKIEASKPTKEKKAPAETKLEQQAKTRKQKTAKDEESSSAKKKKGQSREKEKEAEKKKSNKKETKEMKSSKKTKKIEKEEVVETEEDIKEEDED